MQNREWFGMKESRELAVSPKEFMGEIKKFHEMKNTFLREQTESAMDYFFKGQEQFFDMLSAVMDNNKVEDARLSQTEDSKDTSAE